MEPEKTKISIKRHGGGRLRAWMEGDARWAAAIEQALLNSVQIYPELNADKFRRLALGAGVPEEVVAACIASFGQDDDVYLVP